MMKGRLWPFSTTLVALASILSLTSAASLSLSSSKLFWQDELFEFYSDARPSFRAVILGQRHFPFSLEPPAFHLLLHAMQRLPLRPEIATRLPSWIALLVTQVCVFVLTTRLSRSRMAGLLAAALPMVLVTLDYSAEARVYSLLTATYALAFVCYRQTLGGDARWRRLGSIGLGLSLSAGVLLHYYGLLLPLPFLLAEGLRLLRQRDGRWAPMAAIIASLAMFALDLPFLVGLREIQAKYYDSGEARWDMAALTYLWIPLRGRIYQIRQGNGVRPYLLSLLVGCLLASCLWLLWRRYRWRKAPAATESPLVLALAAGLFVPLGNLAIGIFRSHAYTPRYSLPVAVPLVVLVSVLAARLLERRGVGWIAIGLVVVAGSARGLREGRQARREAATFLGTLRMTPALDAALATVGDPHLYFQDPAEFLTTYFYAPPELKWRIETVQSVSLEWHWFHSAAASLFARNMRASTTLPVSTYEELRRRGRPFLLVVYGTSAEWILQELPADGSRVMPVGKVFQGGTLLRVDPACLEAEKCGSGKMFWQGNNRQVAVR